MAKMVADAINVGPTIMCGRARGHSSFTDVPQEKGGTDTAMLPPEMLCAALANCIGMVIALTCREEGIECAGMTVDVEAEPNEEQARLERFTVVVRMPCALSDEQRVKVEEAAK
ncbi:MAG TPA: hypothetical protein DEP45_11610, partial [Armatimonadetes bacterium]|nr:hypothetical protein [Armatimonadota bacterium]